MPQHRVPSEARFADSHVHLDRYPDAEVQPLLARAAAAGVVLLLTVGCDRASSLRAVELARRFDSVACAAGLHPLWVDVATLTQELEGLRTLVHQHAGTLRAIGETGLDAGVDGRIPAHQRIAFEEQLRLAVRAGLPVVVHSVHAHRQTAALLAGQPGVRAIVHYFNGDVADLRRYLALGCYISFGRLLLKPGHAALRSLAALVPPDRLLAETDTYPLPGRVTEPRDVVEVVVALAEARREPVQHTASLTRANLRAVLGLE